MAGKPCGKTTGSPADNPLYIKHTEPAKCSPLTRMATNSETYLSCTVKRIESLWELEPGDHIRVRGELGEFLETYSADLPIFTHHMLVVKVLSESRIQVVHKTEDRGVVVETVRYKPEKIDVLVYECPYDGDKAIERARERMDQDYSLLRGNCEHFVTEVKTGRKKSIQVQAVVVGAAVGLGLFAIGGLAYYMFGGKSSKEQDSDSDDDMNSQKESKSASYKLYYA